MEGLEVRGVGGERQRTWNPPFRLGLFFSFSLPDAMSLSSSSLTRFELFFLVFFLGSGAFFLVFPPRVARPLRAFSSACSLRANAASSSSAARLFFAFFLGGAESSSSERADSSSGERFWSGVAEVEAAPFSTVGMGSWGSVVVPFTSELNLSKRCMMSAVIASWTFLAREICGGGELVVPSGSQCHGQFVLEVPCVCASRRLC